VGSGIDASAFDLGFSDCRRLFRDSITLLLFVQKRRDLPFNWMFVCFGVFIVACGMTHVMEIITLWKTLLLDLRNCESYYRSGFCSDGNSSHPYDSVGGKHSGSRSFARG
jgi:hypothetical protein